MNETTKGRNIIGKEAVNNNNKNFNAHVHNKNLRCYYSPIIRRDSGKITMLANKNIKGNIFHLAYKDLQSFMILLVKPHKRLPTSSA